MTPGVETDGLSWDMNYTNLVLTGTQMKLRNFLKTGETTQRSTISRQSSTALSETTLIISTDEEGDEEVFKENEEVTEKGRVPDIGGNKRQRQASEDDLQELRKMLKKITKTSEDLYGLMKENTNTKKEMKEGIRRLKNYVETTNRVMKQVTL